MKIRSFLAFDIPVDVRAKLEKVIKGLAEKESRVRWTRPENMHVTIKFFGSVEEELLLGPVSEVIQAAVRTNPTALLECRGIGVFPNWKYPRVIWAGFAGETKKVIDIQKGVEAALNGFDLHHDNREFKLHLTLGRVKGILKNSPIVGLLGKLGTIPFGEVAVKKLVLYKSVLTKEEAVYTPLRIFNLKH